nr:zinc finger MYM-type protein 1-like [Ipomoea batatas]GME09058.1 zinc finger MYM-type protein 1-like [Ipomoea batatas]
MPNCFSPRVPAKSPLPERGEVTPPTSTTAMHHVMPRRRREEETVAAVLVYQRRELRISDHDRLVSSSKIVTVSLPSSTAITEQNFSKAATKKNYEDSTSQVNPSATIERLNFESRPKKFQRVEINEKFDIQALEHDPGLRLPIWKYTIDKRDEVRRAYIKAGPYQSLFSKYPKSGEKHPRRFQASWFKLFPSWLEYSPSKDAAFCLPCYLFHTKDGPSGLDVFTINGFRSWKKFREGTNCSFLAHIGKDLTSPHRNAEKACADLMNQQSHIAQHIEKFTSQEIVENRLRLRTSIEATR